MNLHIRLEKDEVRGAKFVPTALQRARPPAHPQRGRHKSNAWSLSAMRHASGSDAFLNLACEPDCRNVCAVSLGSCFFRHKSGMTTLHHVVRCESEDHWNTVRNDRLRSVCASLSRFAMMQNRTEDVPKLSLV